MNNNLEKAFDFEYWAGLWKRDPEAFEAERSRLMEMFIASVPKQKRQRLRAVQWRVDMMRKQAKTPMAASFRLQQMMWESLCGDHGLLNALDVLRGAQQQDLEVRQPAPIIPFDRSKNSP